MRSVEEINKSLIKAKEEVCEGGYYAHYKHPNKKAYQVVLVGIFEESESVCVVYKSLESGIAWVRTLENFCERVEYNGKQVKRFERIEMIA